MKIKLLIDAKLIGGTETHVMNLCQGLIAQQHECAIVFLRDYPDNPLYAQCDARGIPYIKAKCYKDLFKLLYMEQPDVIHTHGYKANIIGRLLKPVCKSCLIASYHAGEPPVGRLILYHFLDRWTSFLSYNIAVNASIAMQLPSSAEIIPNFVQMPAQLNRIKEQGPYHVYFIGRFSPEKDPLAFCQLAAMTSTDLKWHAVGTGPLLKESQEKAGERIHFHGAISNMDDIWPDVDLLCITSIYEGLPLVLLEAMSRGIPLVSFDVGSVKTIVLNKDYVIKPSELTQMHECILDHFAQPFELRQQMAESARQHIHNHFSSEVIIPQIEDFYRRCIHDN